MGNRAVISFNTAANSIGAYLHWNGGPESVLAFLEAAKRLGIMNGGDQAYFFDRFCQMVGNFFGGTTSLSVGKISNLDTDNMDNGWYILNQDLSICERRHTKSSVKSIDGLDKEEKEKYEGVLAQTMANNRVFFEKDGKAAACIIRAPEMKGLLQRLTETPGDPAALDEALALLEALE